MEVGLGRAKRRREDMEGVARIGEVWANSELTRQNVLKVYGRSDASVVYPGIRFPESPARRGGLTRIGLRVLSVTRLERIKNVDTVIRGFAQFLAKGGGQGALHIGGEGPERARLEGICRQLGVEAKVRFHGFVSDEELDRIAAGCDVFALLPIDEPFERRDPFLEDDGGIERLISAGRFVEFSNVELTERELLPGEAFSIVLPYDCKQAYEDIEVDIAIYDLRDPDLHYQGTNHAYGKRIDLNAGKGTLAIELQNLQINGSLGWITVAIWCVDDLQLLGLPRRPLLGEQRARARPRDRRERLPRSRLDLVAPPLVPARALRPAL